MKSTERQIAPLLELDPDLGQLLTDERQAAARRELMVSVRHLEPGIWDAETLSGASPEHLGLLLVDGIVAREVLVSDTISTELLGPGDIIRPWRVQDSTTLLQYAVRWNALTPARFALLDRRVSVELARYPEVGAAIVDRVDERAARLAVTQAISQLNRVDRRLLSLFWHLAERWGRMTSNGVALPMTLSHRMLGQLIGARRPTVSTAVGELVSQGEIKRRDDGSWLLTGEPVGMPRAELERVVPIRRRLLPPEPATRSVMPAASLGDGGGDVKALRAAVRLLREQCERQIAQMRDAFERTSRLAESTADLRERTRATRRRYVRNGGPQARA